MSERTEESGIPSPRLTSGEERRKAGGHWLLGAAPASGPAREDWDDWGSTWLRPGVLFTAVTVSADLIHRALGKPGPAESAQALAGALDGAVFYREMEFGPVGGYTVFLPPSAAETWRVRGTVVLPPAALFLVPAPDRCEPATGAHWWVVPLDGPEPMCSPALLASLLARAVVPGGEAAHA